MASQPNALAYEQPFGEVVHGLFSYTLMQALISGAGDEQNQLTTRGLQGALRTGMFNLSKGTQTPEFYPDMAQPIVVIPKVAAPTAPTALITFDPSVFGQDIELQDGSYVPMFTHRADATAWELTLKPGLYNVQVVGQDQTAKTLRVRPAQTPGPAVPSGVLNEQFP